MHRPRPAEGDQRAAARIMAALDRDDAQGGGHVGVHDLDHARRRLGRAHPERRADLLAQRPLRRRRVDRQVAAEQRLPVEIAQHDVGVADGGLGAAAAIADRARLRTGALRADLQRAAGIDPGDAAAAGADLGEVDDGHADRVAGAVQPAVDVAVAAHLVFGRHSHLAAGDQAGLRRRAAHVERDQVGPAELPADQRGGDDAGRRAGLDRHRRHAQRLGGLEHAAAGAASSRSR